jgi:hypothetical protein
VAFTSILLRFCSSSSRSSFGGRSWVVPFDIAAAAWRVRTHIDALTLSLAIGGGILDVIIKASRPKVSTSVGQGTRGAVQAIIAFLELADDFIFWIAGDRSSQCTRKE